MSIGGVELNPESTLKPCTFLKVGMTGSKAQVWQRRKQAVTTSKLRETAEISKKPEAEF